MSERPNAGTGLAEHGAEAPTNGERDEQLRQAVDAARRAVEERATAEILALGDDLERERARAASSLEKARRRVEAAEAKAAATAVADDQGAIRVQAGTLQTEFDGQLEILITRVQAETETRVRAETERELAEAEERVRGEVETLEREAAERRVTRAAETARHQAQTSAQAVLAKRESELATELERARSALRTADQRLRQTEMRAEAAEGKLRAAEEAEAQRRKPRFSALRARRSARAEARAKAQAKTTDSGPPGLLDANEATFEELRRLGMTVTQATRVIAYRERANGFETIDDMDTIPGFPKSFVDELKEKLTA